MDYSLLTSLLLLIGSIVSIIYTLKLKEEKYHLSTGDYSRYPRQVQYAQRQNFSDYERTKEDITRKEV